MGVKTLRAEDVLKTHQPLKLSAAQYAVVRGVVARLEHVLTQVDANLQGAREDALQRVADCPGAQRSVLD